MVFRIHAAALTVLAFLSFSPGAQADSPAGNAGGEQDAGFVTPAGYAAQLADYFSAKTSGAAEERDTYRMTRLQLQVMQQAIERWSLDHAEINEFGNLRQWYPASISQLVQQGYLPAGIYPNAVTAETATELNAVEVPMGWTPAAAGNFSYFADLRSASRASSYALIGYAPRLESGLDADGDGKQDGICCIFSSSGASGRSAPSPATAMWQGGRSYNIGLMFSGPDSEAAEFYYNKREGRFQPDRALDLAKIQLHGLQLALERYSVDYSPPDEQARPYSQQEHRYPEAISALVQEGYALAGFYANPFFAASHLELNARELPFGWTEQSPGNFSYLKRYDEQGNVNGYCLLLYAESLEAGRDVTGDGVSDGVALWLSSNMNLSAETAFYSGSQRVVLVNR